MTIGISVIICTYNRAGIVAQALDSLVKQTYPGDCFEVLVVDNNSTDATAHVVASYSSQIKNLRYLLEPRQGLSHARNRGWREARGAYVAYIDDDCVTVPEWLAALACVIEQRRSAILGGPALALYNSPRPHWYRDSYGSQDLADSAGPLQQGFLHGMNIVFRHDILEQLGGFDPSYGMRGTAIGYGEDILPQIKLRQLLPSEEIYFDPQLLVYHLVRPEKMTMGWMVYQRFTNGAYAFRLFHGEDAAVSSYVQLALRAMLAAGGLAADLVIGLPTRDRLVYPYAQNYLCDHAFRHVEGLGSLYEQYRQVSQRSRALHDAQVRI